MSARSIRRAHARRLAKEGRRDSLRLRRAGLIAGAAVGMTAMGGASAQASTFQVTTNADSGAGSLRQAISDAASAPGDDTITFANGLGTIVLSTPLSITDAAALTIAGPGASAQTISGDTNASGAPDAGDSQIFDISAAGDVTISGLTLTNGYDTSTGGGAVFDHPTADDSSLSLVDTRITDSVSTDGNGGGGIYRVTQSSVDHSPLTLTRSTITGNTATAGNGGGINARTKYASDRLTITDSTISQNTSESSGSGGIGGGLYTFGAVTVDGSTVSGNTATNSGGGFFADGKYGLTISDSVISGNTAHIGGGMVLAGITPYYAALTLRESTVSGNHASHGAGVFVGYVAHGDRVTIDRTTISGNDGGAGSFGGGVLVDVYMGGVLDVLDSTVSGNTATAGGGVSLGSDTNTPVLSKYEETGVKTPGTVSFDNSTIASNAASAHGGGIYLSQYDDPSNSGVKKSPTATITSTIVANNTAAGNAEDLDRVDGSPDGGFGSAFSLIEQPGDAPLTKQSTIVGVDPQLGALADNGGPTRTELPSGTSPVIDQGHADSSVTADQRDQPRTVETDIADPTGGDGTDIGSVELAKGAVVIPTPPTPPAAPKPAFTVTLRQMLLGKGNPLLVGSSTPVHCNISIGSLKSCVLEVRAAKATKAGSKTVPAGTLLGSGSVTSTSGAATLVTGVILTLDGRAVLENRPLGIDAKASVVGSDGGTHTATGSVHLLHGPWITLPVPTRSPKLPKSVLGQIDRAAKLIVGAKSVTCTAYTSPGKRDITRTRAQAKAACTELVNSGLKAKVTSVGMGHAKPLESNRTPEGRAANRRIRISFRY